mgnify:CR=1 FL=1
MKSIVVLVAFLSFSVTVPVWADSEHGEGKAETKGDACGKAKHDAESKCNSYSYRGVEKYEKCDCDEDSNTTYSGNRWSCSVDAYCGEARTPLATLLHEAATAGAR